MGGGLTLKPGENTCSIQNSFHWQKITKELATEKMTHQPSDPTQPPVPLPFSLTRSLSDCHFTSKGMFVMKALYLLVGLAYGSKRLPPLFMFFSFLFSFWAGRSPSLNSKEKKNIHKLAQPKRQYLIFQANYPGKFAWLSQAKLHITQEYWLESLKLKWSIELKTAIVHSWKSIHQKNHFQDKCAFLGLHTFLWGSNIGGGERPSPYLRCFNSKTETGKRKGRFIRFHGTQKRWYT